MSGNFPAFGLSRQYHLGKGLDINYLTSSFFPSLYVQKNKNRVRIFLHDYCNKRNISILWKNKGKLTYGKINNNYKLTNNWNNWKPDN